MEEVKLSDKLSRRHIRFTLSEKTSLWQKWESKDRENWTLIKTGCSLDDVIKEREKVKNRNYFNLFKLIFKR
jgi:hypothetical protein